MWAPNCSTVTSLTLLAGAFHAHCQIPTHPAAVPSVSTPPELLPGEITRARRSWASALCPSGLAESREIKTQMFAGMKYLGAWIFTWFPIGCKEQDESHSLLATKCSSIPSFWASCIVGFPFLCAQLVLIICFLNVSSTTVRSIHIPTKSDWESHCEFTEENITKLSLWQNTE